LYIQECSFKLTIMKTEKILTEELKEVMTKEKKHFTEQSGDLSEIYAKLSKIGIDIKSTYSLPLKDTIGKVFREQIQFKNS